MSEEKMELQAQDNAVMQGGLLDERALQQAEKQIDYLNRAKRLAIRATNELDWCWQGSVPYLQESGAQKVAGLFGIGFHDIEITKSREEDDKGGYIVFDVTATCSFRGREMMVDGSASSRDDFFAKRKDRASGEYYTLPLSEISLPNIKKKAVTNMYNRGVKKILGLKFTAEELQDAGINTAAFGKIEYKQGKQGGEKRPGQKNKKDFEEINKMKAEIWSMAKQMCGTEDDARAFLTNEMRVESVKKLPVARTKEVYKLLKENYSKNFAPDDDEEGSTGDE